jgi:hypothetical protein
MPLFRNLCASVMLFLALTASAAAAEVVYPPGMRVGLEPPLDAKVSTRISGFEDLDRKVAIGILDLPGAAYGQIQASMFGANQQGLEDVKREAFPFNDGIAFLLSGLAHQNGVTLHKWFFLAATSAGSKVQNLTTLINVEVPDSAFGAYTDAVIRKALSTVTFRPTPINEQLGMLPFNLGAMSGFRVVQVMPEGSAILIDGPGEDINRQPYMLISVGRGGPSEPDDRSRFARDLMQSAPVRDLTLQSGEPMRIGGYPGYEIRATGKSLTGDAISLVQWLRFGGGGFMRIIGVARTDQWDTLFPRFRAVRDGVDLK